MIRIAICDDKAKRLSEIETLLKEYQAARSNLDIVLNISFFQSSENLLEYIRTHEAFDLYILDVIMPESNGIDLGHKIRHTDKCGTIFYISSSTDYAIDAFDVAASQYLLKPVDKELLFKALDNFYENWSKTHLDFITIKTHQGLHRIAIDNIVYSELVGHCVHYHLSDNTKIEGMSLRTAFRNAVKELLDDSRFALCGASFAVNLSFVENINNTDIELTGGESLPVSRRHRTNFVNEWLNYHIKRGGEE